MADPRRDPCLARSRPQCLAWLRSRPFDPHLRTLTRWMARWRAVSGITPPDSDTKTATCWWRIRLNASPFRGTIQSGTRPASRPNPQGSAGAMKQEPVAARHRNPSDLSVGRMSKNTFAGEVGHSHPAATSFQEMARLHVDVLG